MWELDTTGYIKIFRKWFVSILHFLILCSKIAQRSAIFFLPYILIQVLSAIQTLQIPYGYTCICRHVFIFQGFSFSSGCAKVESPFRRCVWIIVKTMCVMKHYGILALDLEVYIRKGLISFHNHLFSPSLNVTFGNLRLKCLWHLPITSVKC